MFLGKIEGGSSPHFKKYMPPLESEILSGSMDTEDMKLGVLLGVWKPISPTEVMIFLFTKKRENSNNN